jgi:hypothetical protein
MDHTGVYSGLFQAIVQKDTGARATLAIDKTDVFPDNVLESRSQQVSKGF